MRCVDLDQETTMSIGPTAAAVAASIFLAACATSSPPTTVPVPVAPAINGAFSKYTDELLEEYWREFPEFAFYAGNYKYADRMTVPDQARRERNRALYSRHLERLKAFDVNGLPESQRVDWVLIKNRLESSLWAQETFRAWQWQPSSYNVGGSLGPLLTREYAPLDTRLRH
jgi:Bacterial protein of unknown function (DUF885)